MAKYNEILVGRFNRFLQKFLSMKGGPPAPQLSGDIQAQFQLDDANYLENRFTAGWRSYGAVASAAAGGAGNRSAVFLRNPVNSGIVLVIEKITIDTGATAADGPIVSRTQGPANQTAGVAAGSRDNRQTGVSAALFGSSVNAGAVNGFSLWAGSAPAAFAQLEVILTENQEIVVMPGDLVAVWSALLNQAVTAVFFWRERALEEGELV